METMQSAVGHPFPTKEPFNHRQTLGSLPHYLSVYNVSEWNRDRMTIKRKNETVYECGIRT